MQSLNELFRSTQHCYDIAPFEVSGKTETISENFWITALEQIGDKRKESKPFFQGFNYPGIVALSDLRGISRLL